jgi:hypothetical protein
MSQFFALAQGYCFLKCRPIFFFTFLHLRMKICKYMFVWQQCEGSTTMSNVYPVTSHFILDQRIVAYKVIEHYFHGCAAVCKGICLVVSFLVQVITLKICIYFF